MTSDKHYQEMGKAAFKLVSPQVDIAVNVDLDLNEVEADDADLAASEVGAGPISAPSAPPAETSGEAYFAPIAALAPLAGPPIDFRDDNFWERRGRQIFNFVYFGMAVIACYIIGGTSAFLYYPSLVFIGILAVLTLLAGFYSLFHKRVIGRSYLLSLRTQRNLRRVALSVPIPLMLLAGSNALGQIIDYSWHRNLAAHDAAATPADHIANINRSLAVAPLSTVLAEHLYNDAVTEGLANEELMLAERMNAFDPTSARWKIRRMAALHKLPDRTVDYLTLRQEYEKTMADDGFFWNTLADIAVADGDLPTALQMANEHIRLHPDEEVALQQRGDIEKALGMAEEAENDFASARSASGGQ